VPLVLEAHQRRLQHAGALDVDLLMTVDQDVVDHRILEERLDRPEAGHLIEDFRDKVLEFLGVERKPFCEGVLRDESVHVAAHLFVWHFFQH